MTKIPTSIILDIQLISNLQSPLKNLKSIFLKIYHGRCILKSNFKLVKIICLESIHKSYQ